MIIEPLILKKIRRIEETLTQIGIDSDYSIKESIDLIRLELEEIRNLSENNKQIRYSIEPEEEVKTGTVLFEEI